MRYFHLRNSKNEPLVTIAGEINGETINYGVAVVGQDELRNKVSYATGRMIASSRVNKSLVWKKHGKMSQTHPAIFALQNMGFAKAGSRSMGEFVESIRILRNTLSTFNQWKSK